jgi:hypothetical protein
MSKIFKKDDIKAGYLLQVKGPDKVINMTVVPTTEFGSRKAGDLACCAPGKEWWPVDYFTDDLTTPRGGFKVVAVYGYTDPRYLLDNDTEHRTLLWERETAKKMTVAEIAKALGYPFEIVEG